MERVFDNTAARETAPRSRNTRKVIELGNPTPTAGLTAGKRFYADSASFCQSPAKEGGL